MQILHIDCSPRETSHSRQLSAGLLARLSTLLPHARVVRRDLGRDPLPHPQADYAEALSSPGAAVTTQANDLSEQLIREIEAADALVIGTPMNNFTVPSAFKAWIDQILRMGRSIGATAEGGKIGLLQDKPVYIGIASGGVFTGEKARQPDFLMPYLKAAFDCIGLHSLQFFPLQATAFRDHESLAAERLALVERMDTGWIGQAALPAA